MKKKFLMYGVEMDGSTCYTAYLKDALAMIECDLAACDEKDDGLTVTITLKAMTQKEYEALPEFEGW